MGNKNNILTINQLDNQLQRLSPLKDLTVPENGWINLFRTSLNMSLRQLADRMDMTIQGASKIEKNEAEGVITINTLKKAAEAMDLKLVYGFVPNNGSLEKLIEQKATEMASKIVMRTSTTMKLEDQEVSSQRIKAAIEELTAELKKEIPKSLWD